MISKNLLLCTCDSLLEVEAEESGGSRREWWKWNVQWKCAMGSQVCPGDFYILIGLREGDIKICSKTTNSGILRDRTYFEPLGRPLYKRHEHLKLYWPQWILCSGCTTIDWLNWICCQDHAALLILRPTSCQNHTGLLIPRPICLPPPIHIAFVAKPLAMKSWGLCSWEQGYIQVLSIGAVAHWNPSSYFSRWHYEKY